MSNSCSIAHFAQRRMRAFQALPQGRGKIPSYFVKFLRFSSLNLQKFASSERYFADGCCRFFKLYGALEHKNLKQLWREGRAAKRRFGLQAALAFHNLAFEGQHHRAIDDARNIDRLLPWIPL